MSPVASTSNRADTCSPFDSVSICRSALVAIDFDLGGKEGSGRHLLAHGVHQVRVVNAALSSIALLNQTTEARDRQAAVRRRRAQHCIGQTSLVQDLDLADVKFLAAEIRRINLARIYQENIRASRPVCAENLNPSIVVMQATQDWTCSYEPGPLDRA